MKLAISNLAWDFGEDDGILKILQDDGFTGIELAPAKIYGGPENMFQENWETVAQTYRKRVFELFQINVVAFQALVFGHPELRIFETLEIRQKTLDYLKEIILLAKELGAKNLIFGSPKNRDILGNSEAEAWDIAIDFFSQLGDFAQKNNTCFCIEPNPKEYGCNFINTSTEAAKLVRSVDNQGFRLHLDSGAMHMNGENYETVISKNIDIIAHFHASNPYLKGFENSPVDHRRLGEILKENNYQNWVSIEMLPNSNQEEGIASALEVVKKNYS